MKRCSQITKNGEYVKQVVQMILDSNYLVILTGAGISTESGLADFRGDDGIWTRRDKGLPPPKSKHFDEVQPNLGHQAIVKLQNLGLLKFLISQNVDNLHLRSGIKPELIAELHGNYKYMKCIDCDKRYHRDEIGWDREIHGRGFRTEKSLPNQPVCPSCNGRIISSIVNFKDPMPQKEMKLAKKHTNQCDLMLVVGSSLMVQPAANLPNKAKKNGAKLVILNINPTPLDDKADLKLDVKIGEFLDKIVTKIETNL